MAQTPETHTAQERRIAELENELRQRDRRITELEQKLKQRDRRITKIDESENEEDEAFDIVKEEVGNWTSTLAAAVEAYVETYNEYARAWNRGVGEYARAWNRGVGELGADLAHFARRGFLRLARASKPSHSF